MTLLLDIGDLPDDCCTDGLEAFAKAISFGNGGNIWDKVPNRWASPLVESVSARLVEALEAILAALDRFFAGRSVVVAKAMVPWIRWDEARFEQVRSKLMSMDPDKMTIADYELLIEWLINRYLPQGVIESEAEFLAVRAALLGKIQSNLEVDHRVTDPMIGRIVDLLPTTFAAVPPHVFTPLEAAMLEYGRAHAAEAIRSVSDQIRHKMANLCMQHVQGIVLGQPAASVRHLQTALFDQFSTQNLDFRRIAITEVGEIHNQAYVVAKPAGSRVKRIEAYTGACDFCRSINGLEFEVVSPDAPDKDGATQVWAGKTNVGRSASPMKRLGDKLIERGADEVYWAASGLQHPNCRGAWVPVTTAPPGVSGEFFDMLNGILDQAA